LGAGLARSSQPALARLGASFSVRTPLANLSYSFILEIWPKSSRFFGFGSKLLINPLQE
jgi:hypothetical protein